MPSKHKHSYALTIRLGAAHDEVGVAGLTFDRSRMTGAEKSELRKAAVLAMMDTEVLPKNSRRLPFKVREELDARRKQAAPKTRGRSAAKSRDARRRGYAATAPSRHDIEAGALRAAKKRAADTITKRKESKQ